MSVSETSICNSALIKVGSKQLITSLTQGTPNATLCGEQYPKIRDELLRSHNWNFASRWQELETTGNTPTAAYDYEFQLPTDLIRVIHVANNDRGSGTIPYDLYNDKLYCDSNQVFLKYISKVTDPNLFPADFREALASALAYDISYAMTDSNSVRDSLEKQARRSLSRAKTADAQENYPERMPEGSWVTSRPAYGSVAWNTGST